MAKVQTRHSVSISGALYNQLRSYCADKNIPMASFIEAAVKREMALNPLELTVLDAVTENLSKPSLPPKPPEPIIVPIKRPVRPPPIPRHLANAKAKVYSLGALSDQIGERIVLESNGLIDADGLIDAIDIWATDSSSLELKRQKWLEQKRFRGRVLLINQPE